MRKSIPRATLRALHERASERCEECGGEVPLSTHHRKPVSLGGDNSLPNLARLCDPCHLRADRAAGVRRGRPPTGDRYTKRLMVYLEPEQMQTLERLSDRKGVSLAETVRQAVRRMAEQEGVE